MAPKLDRGTPTITRSTEHATELGTTGLVLVCAVAAVWTAVVSAAAVWRHDQFLSHRFDLGNMVQAVWSTAHGRPLEMTDAETGEQIVRLGAHVDPILALLAPLWWAHPTPATLLVVQAAALASGMYPAVRLALKHSHSNVVATLVGAWYLVFPWIVWSAFDDFHPVTLAIPLLLYAIWFLDDDRLVPFAIVSALAMATGELVALTVAGIGVWYALAHRRYRAGGAIAFAGVCWFVVCVSLIVPAFNDGRESRFYDRFDKIGGSPTGVVRTLVTDPLTIVEQLTAGEDIRYVLLVLAPTAFLALLTPLLLLALLPQLGVNLLAEWSTVALPMFHYVSALVPVVVSAAIIGLARLPARWRVVGAAAALGASVFILAVYPPRPGAQAFVFPERYPIERVAAMRAALDLVPASAPVAATNRLGAHVSDRRIVQLFPETAGAQWAIIDTRNPWLPGDGEAAPTADFARQVERLDRDPAWRLRFARQGVRVYQRVP